MSYFGNQQTVLEEFVIPKVNYQTEWDKLFDCKDFADELLIPFMKRLSCADCNVDNMQLANEYFFTVNKGVVRHFIVLQKKNGYKYMKSLKKEDKDDKLDFLIEYVCKYYNWTKKEFDYHKEFIDLMDSKLHLELHKTFGFEKNECKLLGITQDKIKVKFEKVQKVKGWF